jgi:hypothetical protein
VGAVSGHVTVLKVGDKFVEFVTEEQLDLTDDIEKAGWFTWEGSVRAEELVRFHLAMDKVDGAR